MTKNDSSPDATDTAGKQPETRPGSLESWGALAYFALFLAYLFLHQESELHHWGTMVVLPFLLIWAVRRGSGGTLGSTLAGFGLKKGNLTRGLGLTLALGVAIGFVQVFASRSGPAVLEAFANGRAVWLLPLAFLLTLGLAGFTEEFFFRGFLQTRLERLTGSRTWGLVIASIFFGAYHLPYAYFNPNWPSAGDWGAAWSSALGQGIPGGLILGGLFLFTRKNLLACIILHALIDAFPVMGMIRFGP
jgi:membrane protease YdiL (CAAX protease family)